MKKNITKEGQEYVDEPVFVRPTGITPVRSAVAKAFGSSLPEPIHVGYERVTLKWVKPDGTPRSFQ